MVKTKLSTGRRQARSSYAQTHQGSAAVAVVQTPASEQRGQWRHPTTAQNSWSRTGDQWLRRQTTQGSRAQHKASLQAVPRATSHVRRRGQSSSVVT
jgi:hypothetical protein